MFGRFMPGMKNFLNHSALKLQVLFLLRGKKRKPFKALYRNRVLNTKWV